MDIWVGIFVAIGIGATVFVALRVANLASSTSEATYHVTAEFSNIGGLKVRAPVKSAGVVVGQRYPFSQDTSATILTSGLLGEQYVGLESGAETENLKDGSKIILTSSSLVLESLISEFLFNKASE